MTTRLYFRSASGDNAVSPGFASVWDQTTGAVRNNLVRAKSDSGLANRNGNADVSTSAGFDVLNQQYITDDVLPAGAVSGTFRGVMGALESNAAADCSLQVVIRVVSNDGSTERGVLYAGHTTALSATAGVWGEELATTRTSRLMPSTSLSSVTASAGDRIVVEIGGRFDNTVATSYTQGHTRGDPLATADFPFASGSTTNLVPWIEFSQDLFPTVVKANSGRGGTVGADVTSSDSGGANPFDEITIGATGSIKYVTDSDRGTVYEITNGTAGETTRMGWSGFPAMNKMSAAFYIKWAANATSSDRFYGQVKSNTGGHSYLWRTNITNTVQLRDQTNSTVTGGATSGALTTGVWYRIEIASEQTGPTTLTTTYNVYVGDSTTALYTNSAVTSGTTEDMASKILFGWFAGNQVTSMRISSVKVASGDLTSAFGPDPASAASYSQTGSDTAAATDAATRALVLPRTTSDTAAATDAATRQSSRTRTGADTAAATDVATQTRNLVRSGSDTAAATDAAVGARSYPRTATDTAAATAVLTSIAVWVRTASDTAAATEAATRTLTLARTPTDTAPASASLTSLTSHGRTSTDTASATDSTGRTGVFVRTIPDAAAATDAATRQASRGRTASDVLTISDAGLRAAGRSRTSADSAAATEVPTSISLHPRTTGESIPTSDAAVRATGVTARSASDSAPAPNGGSVVRQAILARILTEAAFASDTAPRLSDKIRAISDAAGGTDFAVRAYVGSRTMTDATATFDSVVRLPQLKRSAPGSAPASEGLVRLVSTFRTAADQVDLVPTQYMDGPTVFQEVERVVTDSAPAVSVITGLQTHHIFADLVERIGATPGGGGAGPALVLVDGRPAIRIGTGLYTEV